MNSLLRNSATVFAGALLSVTALAQDPTPPTPPAPPVKGGGEQQEIVIRKKDGKAEKMTIVVDGENVTINGKPVDEFKGSGVTIMKRKSSDAPRAFAFGGNGDSYRKLMEAEDMADAMKENKAFLGVSTQKTDDGAKIIEVTKGSAAEKAGLKKDDIITKVGSTKISTHDELTEAISTYKPNDKVDITYKRNGKESKATATLGERKARVFAYKFNNDDFNNNDFDFNFDMPPGTPGAGGGHWDMFNHKPKIGLQIEDVEEGKGATVKDVDESSPAAKAGLKEGDVITQVNGKDIAGVDDIREQIKDLKEGDVVKVTYKRGTATQTVDVKMPKKLKTANL